MEPAAIDPAELVRRIPFDEEELTLRPVRPSDVDRINAGLALCTIEDIHFRFGTGMTRLPPNLAVALTQLDYSRHMALLAETDQGEVYGVARLVCHETCRSAEFALIVRSDKQKHGLGATLFRTLLDYAERRGVEEIWGDVARENTRMRRLAREMGFHTEPGSDLSRIRVVREL